MATKKNRTERFVALDPDRLGLLAAAAMGTLVLGISFWRSVGIGTALVRSGLALVIGYASVFLLVRYMVRAALHEIAEEKIRRREQRQQEEAAEAAERKPE